MQRIQAVQRIVPKFQASILLFIGAIGLALVASFGLADWAETSSLHHGLQHALLFTAGLSAGTAISLGLKQRRDR